MAEGTPAAQPHPGASQPAQPTVRTPIAAPTASQPGTPSTGSPASLTAAGTPQKSPTERAAAAGERKDDKGDKEKQEKQRKLEQDDQPAGKVKDKNYKRKFFDPRNKFEGADDSKPEKGEFDPETGGPELKVRDVELVEAQQKKDWEHLQSQMAQTEEGGQLGPVLKPTDEANQPDNSTAEGREETLRREGGAESSGDR